MPTETQVVKEIVRRYRKHGIPTGHATRRIPNDIYHEIMKGERWGYGLGYTIRRLRKRIMKKLGQPFRRKKRGSLCRKAAGKNEVTRRMR